MNKGNNTLARACGQALKRTPQYREMRELGYKSYEFPQLAFILEHKRSQPNGREVQAFAMTEEIIYNFFPFDMSRKPELKENLFFEFSGQVLEDLENGSKIAYMTPIAHFEMWSEIDERQEEIEYPVGLQLYLEYCRKKSVTKEELEKLFQYDGVDIMKWRRE